VSDQTFCRWSRLELFGHRLSLCEQEKDKRKGNKNPLEGKAVSHDVSPLNIMVKSSQLQSSRFKGIQNELQTQIQVYSES